MGLAITVWFVRLACYRSAGMFVCVLRIPWLVDCRTGAKRAAWQKPISQPPADEGRPPRRHGNQEDAPPTKPCILTLERVERYLQNQ